jgi:hypothetical protein
MHHVGNVLDSEERSKSQRTCAGYLVDGLSVVRAGGPS